MTPAEQAALLAYQQEQQRAAAQNQQDQGGLLNTLGKLALGAAGVSAGWYLGGKALKALGSKGVAPSKVAPSAAEVRRAAGAVPADVARQQRGIELTRLARAERPQGVRQVNLDQLQKETSNVGWFGENGIAAQINAAERVLADPEMQALVKQQRLQELSEARSYQSKAQAEYRNLLSERSEEARSAILKEANTTQAAAQEDFANQYLHNQGYTAADTLVDQQQGRIIGQVDHFANAVNSAEDQTTGRVKAALQRNEDANLAAIEMAEDAVDQQLARLTQQSPEIASSIDVDAAINQVASQLEDGLPVDQAEGALSFAQKRMQEIRKVQEAQGYRGLRAEKQMLQGEQGTRIKQASELYAATGDPNVLSLISETPSLPISVQPKTQQLITTQSLKGDAPSELNTSSLYSPFKERELNVNKQEDVDMRMTNRLSELGAKRETIPKKIINPEYAALEEQTNIAMYAMEQGDPTAANIFYQNRQKFREGKAPPREIINPEYLKLSQQMNEAESLRREVRDIIESKKSNVAQFPSVYRVADLQEGVRPFYQQTPEGEIIPETLELRRGRPSKPTGVVEKPASGTSIRGVGGAVGTGSGSTPGVYEPGAILSDVIIENGEEIYKPVMWQEGTHPVNLRTPEGYVYSEEATQQPTAMQGMRYQTHPFGTKPPEVTLRSFDAAKEIRRIQRSNPPDKAQALVNSFLQQLKGG